MYVSRSFAYWYHSVNGISLGLAQSDPIKLSGVYSTYFIENVVQCISAFLSLT